MKKMIEYKGKMYEATVLNDNQVDIEYGGDMITLDKCKNCGKWCSEDDEMYGDGYCTDCAEMCDECQKYVCHTEITKVGDNYFLCKTCIEKKELSKLLLDALRACRNYMLGKCTELDLVETQKLADTAIQKAEKLGMK